MAPTDLPKDIVLADTATKLGAEAPGGVIVTGSHGGRYAAYLTLKAHPAPSSTTMRASARTRPASPCIAMAQALGVAAATLAHASCRIGDASDMMARGVVSHANAPARALGVAPGMACRDAALRLIAARATGRDPDPCEEARRVLENPAWRRRIVLMTRPR